MNAPACLHALNTPEMIATKGMGASLFISRVHRPGFNVGEELCEEQR